MLKNLLIITSLLAGMCMFGCSDSDSDSDGDNGNAYQIYEWALDADQNMIFTEYTADDTLTVMEDGKSSYGSPISVNAGVINAADYNALLSSTPVVNGNFVSCNAPSTIKFAGYLLKTTDGRRIAHIDTASGGQTLIFSTGAGSCTVPSTDPDDPDVTVTLMAGWQYMTETSSGDILTSKTLPEGRWVKTQQ